MLIVALPVFLEAEYVLALWLKQYPPHTVNFVRLVLILTMIDILSNTLITLANATGKIRNYQLGVGLMLLMNFPLSYMCLYLGCPPESTLLVAIGVAVACMILRLVFLRKMAQLSMVTFIKNVCVKVVMVAVAASIVPMFLHSILSAGWERLIVVGGFSMISCLLVIFYLGCNPSERQLILSKLTDFKQRIRR